MSKIRHWIATGVLASVPIGAAAEPVAYIDQAAFLNDLASLGHAAVHEGFENDSVWGDVRTPNTAASVTNLGVTWTANNLSSQVTTSNGAARSGLWGLYSSPHGSYTDPDPGTDCFVPGECGDGFRGSAVDGVLYGIGGWIDTNTPFAKVGLFRGTYPDNPVDFGETCDPDGENCSDNAIIGTTPEFFGMIDPAGFERFEYRELEGKLEPFGGDIKLIFSDDFYFAVGVAAIFTDGFESGDLSAWAP
ncbi:MAG: hypothetical protein GY719_41510 [bacterium]|nr:hypothetical protein [bacterium]